MATIYYTENDLLVREACIGCCFADQTSRLNNKLRYGSACDEDKKKVNLLGAYLDLITCYTPIISKAEDGVINCLTEAQMDKLFETITKVYKDCNFCFPPKGNATGPVGAGYPPLIAASRFILLESSYYLLLESGDRTVLEYYTP